MTTTKTVQELPVNDTLEATTEDKRELSELLKKLGLTNNSNNSNMKQFKSALLLTATFAILASPIMSKILDYISFFEEKTFLKLLVCAIIFFILYYVYKKMEWI